jgi:hypothetical protein
MARIELSQLIAEMTVEQKIFVQWFYSQFDNGSAANRRIVNVEPIFYQGVPAGSEFLVYAATKLYICLEYQASSNQGAGEAAVNSSSFYDAANAVNFIYAPLTAYYDGGVPGVRYLPFTASIRNIYFSRVAVALFDYIYFNGYRVTLA